MKSRFAPGECLFQIVVQDFKHRQPVSGKDFYVDKSGKGIREVVDHIPVITWLRTAKNAKRAMESARKKGSIISCRKVDSHLRRLDMITHLRVEQKPFVEVGLEEFILGHDLTITPAQKGQEFEVETIDKDIP